MSDALAGHAVLQSPPRYRGIVAWRSPLARIGHLGEGRFTSTNARRGAPATADHEVGAGRPELGQALRAQGIFSDNGASAEGMGGSTAELNAQNGIPTTVAEHLEVLETLGGLEAIGGPKTDNMYHSAWAWAGDAPFRYTKLIASDWGGTRTPMVVSWPARITPDKAPRTQFHHVNDVAPTLYEILGIAPPEVVDGQVQDPIDGTSFAYTFDDVAAPGR